MLSMLFVLACSGFNYHEDVAENYSLIAVGDRSDLALYYRDSSERVPATVVALGWDQNHVVAKCSLESSGRAERYFVVDRKKDGPHANPRDCVLGPLDSAQFLAQKQQLGLPDFSRQINLN